MIRTTLLLSLLFMSSGIAQADEASKIDSWIQLFNGKDLDGWTPKIRYHDLGVNHGDTFRVEDGLLKVGYAAYDEFNETFGHLFYKDKFSHYRIRCEYRFVGDQCKGGPGWALRNSGIMIHGEDPKCAPVAHRLGRRTCLNRCPWLQPSPASQPTDRSRVNWLIL